MNQQLEIHLELVNDCFTDSPQDVWEKVMLNAVTTFNNYMGTNFDAHESLLEWMNIHDRVML